MRFLAWVMLLMASFGIAQQPVDHLSPSEIATATANKPNSGFVEMMDLQSIENCKGQIPSESLFTPSGGSASRAASPSDSSRL